MHSIRSYPRLRSTLRCYAQVVAQEKNEYTEIPEYPPILDLTVKGRKFRERQTLHEKIKMISTVEEKQIALNMPRYYGWQCIMLNENKIPYNALPLIQCYTRTHFINVDALPDYYKGTIADADTLTKELKSLIEEAICNEHEMRPKNGIRKAKENAVAQCIVKQLNRIITNHLAQKMPHILSMQVDYNPRHEAFWFVGGIDVPSTVYNWRKKYPWLKDTRNEPIDRAVQYIGNPFLTTRSHHPLPPIIPYEEAENPAFKVPKFTFKPQTVHYSTEFRHGTNIPGYWPGDYDEFGLLSIHGRGHILSRKKSFGSEDNLEALHCQAMEASFGWLLAQANYQGFTTFNDITYPLVTQTVITNGQLWSFYAYQLNTIVMHNEQMDENPKHNVCFGTKPLQLYECIENGQVKGFNEDVLKILIQFYMNAPQKRNHDLKPYLGKEEQIVADIEDDKKRCWLEERYKHLVSNRPRHVLLPETYMWEKIYKIQFNTRFQEAKRRPFELGINPFKRRLNEHLPPYIPKVLRPYPKARKKFEDTYYPDV